MLQVAGSLALARLALARSRAKGWPLPGVTLYYSMVQALSNPATVAAVTPLSADPAFTRRALGLGLLGCAAGLAVQGLVLARVRPTGLSGLALGLLPLHGGAAAGVLIALLQTVPRRACWARLALGRPTVAAAIRVLLALAGLGTLVGLVHWGSAALARGAGLETAPPAVLPALAALSGAGALAAAFALLLWVPLVEEVLFRLLLTDALATAGATHAGAWSAAVFAVAHGVPAYAPGLLLLGLGLQHLRRRYGGLWAPLLAHLLYNAFSLAGWLLLTRLA